MHRKPCLEKKKGEGGVLVQTLGLSQLCVITVLNRGDSKEVGSMLILSVTETKTHNLSFDFCLFAGGVDCSIIAFQLLCNSHRKAADMTRHAVGCINALADSEGWKVLPNVTSRHSKAAPDTDRAGSD